MSFPDHEQVDIDALTALVDRGQAAYLYDAGLPDYFAAVCVTPDGETELWLVREDVLNEPDAAHGNADQTHEKLGPLPHEVRERIWGDSLRCGRPRCDGQPCRQRVKEPGQSCAVHCDGTSCGKCRSCYLAAKQDAS